MATTAEQIDLWRQAQSEHQRLEFKEAKNQFDSHKLNEDCVALANEGGGVLLLGIADVPPRAVVMAERMTNQSLRERFRLTEDKAAIASEVIAATIEARLIKADESVGGSRKFAHYLPFWA